MEKHNSLSSRTLIELAILAALAFSVPYWIFEFASSSSMLSGAATILVSPGIFLGTLLGGGPHFAKRTDLYLGVFVQFVLMRLAYRAFKRRAKAKGRDMHQ